MAAKKPVGCRHTNHHRWYTLHISRDWSQMRLVDQDSGRIVPIEHIAPLGIGLLVVPVDAIGVWLMDDEIMMEE